MNGFADTDSAGAFYFLHRTARLGPMCRLCPLQRFLSTAKKLGCRASEVSRRGFIDRLERVRLVEKRGFDSEFAA